MNQSIYTLHILHYIFFGAGMFFLILSIVLFFKLQIRNVFGYLTGISEKKELAQIESKTKGVSRELVTKHKKHSKNDDKAETEKLVKREEKKEEEITEQLEFAATEETMVLEDDQLEHTRPLYPKDVFFVEEDITMVHTKETIRGGLRV